MSRADTVGAKYSPEIQDATDRFADHEGMSGARVLQWMLQFSDDDLPLAAKVLKEVRYFNATNLRGMTHDMVQMVIHEVQPTTFGRIVFVPMASKPGGGADTVARVLRHMRTPSRPRVMTMVDLQERPRNVDIFVFVDDFSGTGDTLAEWWENVEALVRPLGSRMVFAALVMTTAAADRAHEFATAVPVLELGPEADVFGNDNPVFKSSEREAILAYCKQTGCAEPLVRGYGDCGLILAFTHGCPNNSVPILWYGDKGWNTLFLRRAI